MSYYDQFTKKNRSPRDDWRDDEETRRPQRDEGKGVPTGERRPYGDRPANGERRPYGERPANGERRPYGERRENGERRPYGERPASGERRPYGERPASGERRPYGERPANGEHRPYGERPASGERRPYGERPASGERRPYGERPMMREAPEAAPQENEVLESCLLAGRNPIREALRAGRDMEKLLVAKGELIGSAREIVAMAREAKIVVQEVDRARLDAMAPNHQGMIAVVSAYAYHTVEDMLALAKERGEAPLLVILDGVTDPHNLGAIIRSAECVGAHGVIIPERRAVGLTPAAVKASAGAVEHIPVAREVNLTRLIERLKAEGIWVYGAAMEGEDYRRVDFSGPAALVVGSEGEGVSRLVAKSCDKLVSLPMRGQIGSLNASVAAGVLLYAMMGARG
ncbi:MAG: 23S rRNA (guanosine(2251)-2'-O)-methyltransferase RlmB [Clostridiales bacterium]|nr:23S rRNA (guanosine(2251)-2'-O)-methyltransferase RlmB [Clostridiales bacterium]